MNDFNFGNYLCALRTESGLSQKELAAKLGVSDKAVSKWENGRSKPRNDALLTIATLFGISTDELITGGKRTPRTDSAIAHSPAMAKYVPDTKIDERTADMNFIPSDSKPNFDYMCTWELQEVTAKKLGLASGDCCADQRDVLTDELLFANERYYHPYDREYRAGLYLLLDDGWDVPFGSRNRKDVKRFFGTCDPDPKKFPNYGNTPTERLETLNRKAKELSYAGIGLWIATETGGSEKGDLGVGKEARDYWAERARWCESAGVRYWKIDWGAHEDPDYRRMMTEVLHENAPHIFVEHAVCQGPYSRMGSVEFRTSQTEKILPVSDVFRLYDVAPPFKDSSMLMRANEPLTASVGMKPFDHTLGILNAETCASICAAFGCALGIMGGNTKNSSSEACLRWHRLAPPFSVYEADYKKSEALLTDSFFFDRNPAWWIHVKGQRYEETAPAAMARGCELPLVTPIGDVTPFVVASRNPKTAVYSIATLKRTINPNKDIIASADIVFKVGGFEKPIGVFGYYHSLTLVFDEPIGNARIFVQGLMSDEAKDVTEKCRIDGCRITFDGDDMRIFGTESRADDDKADPSFLVKIVK